MGGGEESTAFFPTLPLTEGSETKEGKVTAKLSKKQDSPSSFRAFSFFFSGLGFFSVQTAEASVCVKVDQ